MSECHCCACCGEGDDIPCAQRIRALEAELADAKRRLDTGGYLPTDSALLHAVARAEKAEAERDALKAALTDPGIPHRPIGHGPGTCPRCEVLEAAFAAAKPSPPPAPENDL